MISLLKTDLKRILKDKLFIITLIIAVVLSCTTPLLYKIMPVEGMEEMFSAFGIDMTGKSVFFQCFSPSSDAGLIVPILIGIILFKDYSYGTIRNKIIIGKKRSSIYFSSFIATSITICAIILIQAILALLLSLIFFKYQQTPFTGADFGYLMLSVLFEILVYILISALICFLCVWAKNLGLIIVGYVGVSMLFSIIGGIITGVLFVTDIAGKEVNKFLEILSNINIFTSNLIGSGTTYTLENLLYILLPIIFGTAILTALSIILFNKKDIK